MIIYPSSFSPDNLHPRVLGFLQHLDQMGERMTLFPLGGDLKVEFTEVNDRGQPTHLVVEVGKTGFYYEIAQPIRFEDGVWSEVTGGITLQGVVSSYSRESGPDADVVDIEKFSTYHHVKAVGALYRQMFEQMLENVTLGLCEEEAAKMMRETAG